MWGTTVGELGCQMVRAPFFGEHSALTSARDRRIHVTCSQLRVKSWVAVRTFIWRLELLMQAIFEPLLLDSTIHSIPLNW